ncbi:carbamoyltransferase [Alphaproteobacteria bacterium LSUCC0719]
MKIVGLNHGEFNSSAALIVDGEVVAAAAEERFVREKKTKKFPKNSLEFCLSAQEIKLSNVDAFSQAWNPGAKWVSFNPLISSTQVKREDYFYTIPDHLFNLFGSTRIPNYVIQNFECGLPPVYYIKHHLCHAANAYFLSPFDEAAVLTADWQGELESVTKGFCSGNNIDIFDTQWMPHSIGMFYATFTQILGYRPDNDEWKVMAMSAEAVDMGDFEDKILNTVSLLDNGRFELNQTYYTGALVDQPYLYSRELLLLLDTTPDDLQISNSDYYWQCKVAKVMQKVAERIIWHVLADLYEKTKAKNLVLGGGFFMNSVINGKITENTKFQNVYISHSPDDLGNSIGAALYVHHCILGKPKLKQRSASNLGPKFTSSQIHQVIKRRKVSSEKLSNPEQRIAEILAKGEVVAVLQGRMEFGDRALGFRSILGDPRTHEIKDKINRMIKYRESYRPFAPATLFDCSHQIFEVNKDYLCNYMEKVVRVRREFWDQIPAVTHFDGSGRLQTVQKSENPYFYRIIKEFEKLTDIPVVLNTSFNVNGEPIVLSPDDALNTFFNSGLEYLVMEDWLIRKK